MLPHPWFRDGISKGDHLFLPVLLHRLCCCIIENVVHLLQYCHFFFSPKVALLPPSGSKITNNLNNLIFSGNCWLRYVPMLKECSIRDPLAACLFPEYFMAAVMFHQRPQVPSTEWVQVPCLPSVCALVHFNRTSQWWLMCWYADVEKVFFDWRKRFYVMTAWGTSWS